MRCPALVREVLGRGVARLMDRTLWKLSGNLDPRMYVAAQLSNIFHTYKHGYDRSHQERYSLAMTRQSAPLIPGTTIFDGEAALKGYALNRMCFSFNSAENRAEFVRNEDAYCARFGLDARQREAVRRRNVLAMIDAGGNIYYLAKLAGIFGLSVQDIGAQQTGMTVEAFKARLLAAGK